MLTIVLPTDFSESARNAVKYAVSLYGEDQQYVLFNAYEEPKSAATSMISLQDIMHESSVDSLKEEKAEILKSYPGLNIDLVSEYGNASDSVIQYSKYHDADVIVMGTTGSSGLKRIFLGSVATDVLKKANSPVIVVPEDFEFVSPKRILFTADLEPEESDNKLKDVFTTIVEKNNSKIIVLTIKKPGEEIDEDEAESGYGIHVAMEKYDHEFDVVTNSNIGDAISDYATENQINLLVTTPRQSSWFQQLIKHSISKELAQKLSIPVMAMH